MRCSRLWKRLSLAAAAAACGGTLSAQPAAPAKAVAPVVAAGAAETEADRAAIHQSAQEFVAAFNRGDAKAIAAQWTENGEFQTDSGVTLTGRAEIEQSYANFFKEHPRSTIAVEVGSIRFPARDLAIEEGVMRSLPPAPLLPSTSRYNLLHVREGGRWKVAVCREWAVGKPELQDLAWLIGEWKSSSKDKFHETTLRYEWNSLKTLIRCHFTQKEGGKVVSSGVQTIYIDPRRGVIRSQTITEEGGRGESAWTRDGDKWRLETNSVLASGVETTSMEILARLSTTTVLWRSVDRIVDGQPAPDTDPVKLTLVAPPQ